MENLAAMAGFVILITPSINIYEIFSIYGFSN